MATHDPCRFAALRGHDALRDFLQQTASQDRLAHALLFAGAEGIGKRTFALAFAAWLQCTQRGADSCGECASCRQVAAGSHPDVKLTGIPEKKKEIGVDRAREIKRFTQLRPASAPQKVVIIDSAHCLNVAAQNALLKTLEDPPLRSILILVASNPDALLATVRSRCQRINFQPLPVEVVQTILEQSHGLGSDTARELAAVSEGSPGRALELQRYLGNGQTAPAVLFDGMADARYVDLAKRIASLAQPEDSLQARLEILLAQVRDEAAAAAKRGDTVTAASWLRRAAVIHEAADIVHRRSPNRQLLLDSLTLRLTRA